MYLDFTFQLRIGSATALVLKAIEDVVTVMGEMMPKAKVDFKAEFKGGAGFSNF